MKYTPGAKVTVSAEFTDPNSSDDPLDPTAVMLDVRDPAGVVTTYTYGVGATVSKDSTGNYSADLSVDLPGKWWYRWYSTGTGQAAKEDCFTVDKLNTK